MTKIVTSVSELIGRTPLMELRNIEKEYGLRAKLLAKLEYLNPAGSVKDRVAKEMIDSAEKEGKLKKGTVIIEPTSGNTGIGLAAVAASRGYKLVIVMPDSMSIERRKIMAAYGAELVLTDGKLGMKGAIAMAEELVQKYDDAFIAGQFYNPANPQAHYKTTGPEIFEDTDGKVDYFVAGVGTGGTLSGTAKYLKERTAVKAVAVEPSGSAVISGGKAGPHGLQGIGAGFLPQNLDVSVIDEVVTVNEEQAYAMGRMMGKKEGILVGISSGAALYAAVEIAKKAENSGKTVVVLLPDTGDRYLSTALFE